MSKTPDLQSIEATLRSSGPLLPETRCWRVGTQNLCLRANRKDILDTVARYLHGFELQKEAVTTTDDPETVIVEAYESEPVVLDADLRDWPREASKRGRKDAYCDIPYSGIPYSGIHGEAGDSRIVHKIRTGMTFLQRRGSRIATGPCLENDNQLINFINAQWMSGLQQQGAVIGHASAIVREDRALAIAGLSGGGKSTLMLRLLASRGQFLSNDRVFIRQESGHPVVTGIAKWPRINPGTIVHDAKLHTLMPPEERLHYLSMTDEELREVEKKYDAIVPELYGDGRVRLEAPLHALLVLNWQHHTSTQTRLSEVPLRDDLLPALMKSPGPFYQQSNGHFWPPNAMPDAHSYRLALDGCRIFELTGKVDFDGAAELCNAHCWD